MQRAAPPDISALERKYRFERQRLVIVAAMLGIGVLLFGAVALDVYKQWSGPHWPSVNAEAFNVELTRAVSDSHRNHLGQYVTVQFRYAVDGVNYETGPMRAPLSHIQHRIHHHPSMPWLTVHNPRGLRSRHRVGLIFMLTAFVLLPAFCLWPMRRRMRSTGIELQEIQPAA